MHWERGEIYLYYEKLSNQGFSPFLNAYKENFLKTNCLFVPSIYYEYYGEEKMLLKIWH